MKHFLFLSFLLLVACNQVPESPIGLYRTTGTPAPRASDQDPRAMQQIAGSSPGAVYRYHRTVARGDTLFVHAPTPDRSLVFRYCYVQRRLHHIDVFDYAGETAENVLDFEPKTYQILVDGRDRLPDHYSF